MAKEPHLIQRLFRRLTREGAVAICSEAGVSGYDLYRQITACGAACQVIAPALTPRRPGQRIKTDRRDAVKLVRLFRVGELTAIHVPDEAEEAVRDLTRCREAVRRDVLRWRHRVLKFLDRHNQRVVQFRFACDKALRDLVDKVPFLSLAKCEWARAYYDQQRARGHDHHSALRALGAKWLKITFVMWERHIPYDEQHHLATMARQQLRQRPKTMA